MCRRIPSTDSFVDVPLECPFNLEGMCSLNNIDCFEETFPPECGLEKEEFRSYPDYYEHEE